MSWVCLPGHQQKRCVLSCTRLAVQETGSSTKGVEQVATSICNHLFHIILSGYLPAVATDLLPVSVLTITDWLMSALHPYAQPAAATAAATDPLKVQQHTERHADSPIPGLPLDPEPAAHQAPLLGLPSSVELLPRLPAPLQRAIQERRPSAHPLQLPTTFTQVPPAPPSLTYLRALCMCHTICAAAEYGVRSQVVQLHFGRSADGVQTS